MLSGTFSVDEEGYCRKFVAPVLQTGPVPPTARSGRRDSGVACGQATLKSVGEVLGASHYGFRYLFRTKMLSSLPRQETLFVGEAAAIPARMKLRTLTQEQLPNSNDVSFAARWSSEGTSDEGLEKIVARMAP